MRVAAVSLLVVSAVVVEVEVEVEIEKVEVGPGVASAVGGPPPVVGAAPVKARPRVR